MRIIKPNKLKKGDIVMVVSPSNGVPEELMDQFNNGVRSLECLDLKVKVAKNALGKYFYSFGRKTARCDVTIDAYEKTILINENTVI